VSVDDENHESYGAMMHRGLREADQRRDDGAGAPRERSMRIIIILDDAFAERKPRGHSRALGEADMVIAADGRVLKRRNDWSGYRVDMEKLDSVLNGEKRVTRKKG
jgi:hypothetical protein